MRELEICLSEFDSKRLGKLVEAMSDGGGRDRGYLRTLGEELERARVVPPTDIPPEVVTMNSTARVTDLDKRESLAVTVVYPKDANVLAGKISVLAPIGTALLGSRVGDTVVWHTPGGDRRLRIDEILYQPEAAGAFE